MSKIYKTALVIDDDIDDIMIIQSALKLIAPSLLCSFASNGKEVMEYTESTLPCDIVFIDLNMPLMNGFETLKFLRTIKLYDSIPLIVISTSNHTYDIERAKRLGANRYIVKPGTFPELISRLKEVLQS